MDEEQNKIYSSQSNTNTGSSEKVDADRIESTTITSTSFESSGGASSSSGSSKTIKETFRTGTPDDVRERVKDTVAKGIAAVAGALKGFTEESQKNRLPDQARGAIQNAGETTRSVVSTTTEEIKNTVSSTSDQISGMKEPIRDATRKVGSTVREVSGTAKEEFRNVSSSVRDVGSTVKDEVQQTKSEIGKGSSGSSGSSGMTMGGGSTLGTSTYNLPASQGGSVTGSSKTGPAGGEMPDISNTPLGKSDKELRKGGSSGNQY